MRPQNGHNHTTEAPKAGKFNNPITFGILFILGSMILYGALISIFLGRIWSGTAYAAIGAILLAVGYTKHSPAKPREFGVLTFLDDPITLGAFSKTWANGVVVQGGVFLAPYLGIKSEKVEGDNKDMLLEFENVLTKDEMPMQVKASIKMRPDIFDMIDFLQSGNSLERIIDQIREIVEGKTSELCQQYEGKAIHKNYALVSRPLQETILAEIERGSYGVVVLDVQVKAFLPQRIIDALVDTAVEHEERKAEGLDYGTLIIIAKLLQEEQAASWVGNFKALTEPGKEMEIARLVNAGKVLPFEKSLDMARSLKLTKDGFVRRLETGGNVGSVAIANIDINYGEKGSKKKGKKDS